MTMFPTFYFSEKITEAYKVKWFAYTVFCCSRVFVYKIVNLRASEGKAQSNINA